MKKPLAALLAVALLLLLPACGGQPQKPPGKPYIAIVSKGFQHQFWQAVYAGSKVAAGKLNVDITFEGPPSEGDMQLQTKMIAAALDKKPSAICLAALDTKSILTQLEAAKKSGVPVVGFDSGVPGAPAGYIVATASTNNYVAGGLAASEMFKEPSINKRIKEASPDRPVVISVLSQDAHSDSVVSRTRGFVDKMGELAETLQAGKVAVTGHELFNKRVTGGVAVEIEVGVSATPEYSDVQSMARAILGDAKNLIGMFCSNEGAVTGLLSATQEGVDLDRKDGKYKNLVVVGFDAGASQKHAVSKQYFYGSITQDPYAIGYIAVELAYKASKGEKTEQVVDTGCKFYNHSNINNPEIAQLVYN